MTTKTKKPRRKRCSCCNELKDDVHSDSKLCDECEEDHDYCEICGDWYSPYGEGCRHLNGCGSYHDWDSFKESFFLLLDRLGVLKAEIYQDGEFILVPLVPEMLKYIRDNNFWTQWHGSLLGPSSLRMMYEKDFGTDKSYLELYDLCYRTMYDWNDEGEDVIDGLQDGMDWLTSLDDESERANQQTVAWIEEWMQTKEAS